MQTVLANLKNLSGNSVADIIQKFSGNTPGYNWIMKDGNLGGTTAANTSPTYDRLKYNVTTTFDASVVSNGSDLAFAKTILHESIHAYLVTTLNTDPANFNKTYAQLLNDYNGNGWDANATHHDEMVRGFIGDIGASLKAYGVSQGYHLTDQFYNDLAWGGLQETNAFKNLPVADRNRILNVIIGEQSGTDMNLNPVTPKGKPSGC
ncbi:hypothetical protein IDJ75_17355 [Mucilaginibacter rigui]|uniref:SprT-like domain-containing protein n=1 Tax=Mucilaginibacter rigui TaxID=534635 RepID=A0ABR7X907_9SPHI|nr:hypothetical protein [Mucilaginibacter rigui]MBD1387057.1 hypothetical protein [Mucilaginibacter rigui]